MLLCAEPIPSAMVINRPVTLYHPRTGGIGPWRCLFRIRSVDSSMGILWHVPGWVCCLGCSERAEEMVWDFCVPAVDI